jgi:hypothetical protein
MFLSIPCNSHLHTLEIRNDTFYFMTTYTYLSFPEPLFKHHHSFGEVNSPVLIGY